MTMLENTLFFISLLSKLLVGLLILLAILFIERPAEFYYQKGLKHLKKKQYEKAKQCFNSALVRQPNHSYARQALAELPYD